MKHAIRIVHIDPVILDQVLPSEHETEVNDAEPT